MSRTGEATKQASTTDPDVFQGQIDSSRAHQDLLRGPDGKQACPFCGAVSERTASACARCGMDNTPEARKATKARIGPWYVLQARNPAAPGMRFETLLSFVRKGRVRARSVVRGPTTHQLWRFAAHVKGLSREFGLCYSCGSAIDATANVCPQCNRLQEPPMNPDVLLEDGGEEQVKTVYRELPDRTSATAPASAAPEDAHEPTPEEADIVIPAFGGFGGEHAAAHQQQQQQQQHSQFSEGPPVAPAVPPLSPPSPPRSAAAPPQSIATSPMGVSMSYPPAPPSATPAPQRPAPRPVAPADNPFAIAPARKKNGGGAGADAGAFLSAKELAAAFKLSFDPSAEMESIDVPEQMPASAMPDGMRPGAIVPRNPMGAASPAPRAGAAAAATAGMPRKKRGGFRRFVLFVLILAGTGFGVLMWVDPAFRARTIEWSKAKWAEIQQSGVGANNAAPAGTKPAAIDDEDDEIDAPDPSPSAATTVPSSADTSATAAPEQASAAPEAPVSAKDALEKAAPADAKQPPEPAPAAKTAATPSTTPRKAPAPRPAPVAPARNESADADEQAEQPQQDPRARMYELRKQAVVAEGKGDFKAAVKAWEEIEKLPERYWPFGGREGLRKRIDWAREKAGE